MENKNIPTEKSNLLSVNMESYLLNPDRYEIRSGSMDDAPLCPYGNRYEWIGYDKIEKQYIRFTKSVFKKLIALKMD